MLSSVRLSALIGVVAALLCATPAAAQTLPSERCDTASIQSMAPADTTIAFAAREGQSGCRVSGYVTTQNPGPNRVLFTIGLPNNFNGRYVYLGVGGAGGVLPTLTPTLLERGFALAGSDSGSGARSGNDYSFQSDPARALDYAWRGVHVSAAATQAITRAYYQRERIHRYINGCSAGGVMGMTSARRFGGEDFDGFLVGASPWSGTLYLPFAYRIAQHVQAHPEGWISPELLARGEAAIIARYDGVDGAVDGVIADSRDIENFDLGVLREAGFTPAQIETFNLIRTPMRFPAPGLAGDGVQPPMPISQISAWSAFLLGRIPPPWPSSTEMSAMEQGLRGIPFNHVLADTRTRASHPDLDYRTIRSARELVRISAGDGPDQSGDAMDFGRLAESGAKMIFYHGVNDQAISYLESVSGYEAMRARFPNSETWLRAYMVPGLMHCTGGLGPTDVNEVLLDALIAWVENGTAPAQLQATRYTREHGLERRFTLCAEPQRVRFDSSGASSCVAPPAQRRRGR